MAASGVAMAPDFTSNAPRFRMDARFRMNEAAALALALAAHVGVVALLVLRPAAPPPAPPQRMEVTLADDVGLQASAPSHAPAAADLAPVLGEVQPEPAKPQPAAQPQHEAARSVMVPMPAPIPHHVTKPAPPEKPAKSKPEPKPAPAKAKPWALTCFRAMFTANRNLMDAAVLVELAQTLDIDVDAMRAAITDPAIKDRLRAVNENIVARGVCGAPFFFVDGEPFWGNDRLPQIERWLSAGPF